MCLKMVYKEKNPHKIKSSINFSTLHLGLIAGSWHLGVVRLNQYGLDLQRDIVVQCFNSAESHYGWIIRSSVNKQTCSCLRNPGIHFQKTPSPHGFRGKKTTKQNSQSLTKGKSFTENKMEEQINTTLQYRKCYKVKEVNQKKTQDALINTLEFLSRFEKETLFSTFTCIVRKNCSFYSQISIN